MRNEDRLARLTLGAAFVFAALYALAVCANGVPVLRHDWWWPANRDMSLEALTDAASGWLPNGIGSAAPYPGRYIIGSIVALLSLAFGGLPSLALFSFGTGCACTLGARALGRTLSAAPIAIAALELFVLFNPWVYNQTVAGHEYMVLAYGGCILLLNELLRTDSKFWRTALLPVLILPQLQFFVVALAGLLIDAIVRRRALPLLSAVVISLPIWIGLAFERSGLVQTPYTAAWESVQSVPLPDASVFNGYFAHYTAHFSSVQIGAVWAIVACAVLAVAVSERRVLTVCAALFAIACLLGASGSRGPLAGGFTFTVLHVPESGLFRELYDLLGFAAIAYVLLVACVPRRYAVVGVLALVAAIITASGWATYPVSRYWVNRNALPHVAVNAAPNTRFALLPALQPMQFHGAGSGGDPDAYARAGGVTPVNEYLSSYPVNAAFGRYVQNGDAHALEALSVSAIVHRPWLTSNVEALRLQMNGVPRHAHAPRTGARELSPLPQVTLGEMPKVGTLTNELGAGNVFFDDARNVDSALAPPAWRALPPLVPVRPGNRYVNESQGWVAVQFDFDARPDLAQGIGGAVTTNRSAALAVTPGVPLLVDIDGELRANDRIISRSTHGYAWIPLAGDVSEVRCRGRCVVAGQARMHGIAPLNPPPRAYRAAAFDALTPWLVRVLVPANAPPLLRYNVAYDPNWIVLSPGLASAHVRIDTTVNGWLLQRSGAAHTVYLVQWVAAAQCVCEIAGVLWLLGVIGASVRASARYPRSNRAGAL